MSLPLKWAGRGREREDGGRGSARCVVGWDGLGHDCFHYVMTLHRWTTTVANCREKGNRGYYAGNTILRRPPPQARSIRPSGSRG